MFDAKKLLDQLIGGGAQSHAQPQGGGAGGGGAAGGLSDLLRQFTGDQGGKGGGLGGAGLEDLLGKLQQKGSDAGGGLGDILGKLQQKTGGASGTASGGTSGGGIADILGQILGQATQGAKEGAGKISEATGAGEALDKITGGRSADDLMGQLKELIENNKLAAGAAAGGLGALVLGTRTGRGLAIDAAKLGGLVLVGGLAYKAYQNYQAGKPLIDTSQGGTQAAPDGTGFEAQAVTNQSATLYIRAMIASAAADGRIDEAEQEKIFGSLKQAGLDEQAHAFMDQELRNPATIEDLVAAVGSKEEAVQVFTAARLGVDFDNEAEQQFLVGLAGALDIKPELAQHIDAAARGTG